MSLFITVLCITIAQMPGLIIRYLPISHILELEQKKKIWFYYLIVFLLQLAVVYGILSNNYEVTPLTYKRLIFFLSAFYVSINIMVIKKSFYKHMFVYGMQGGYSLIIHSIIALYVGSISASIPLYLEFAIQTLGYIVLSMLCFMPFWSKTKNSIIFNSTITNDYYWNIIWLIPALAIYC